MTKIKCEKCKCEDFYLEKDKEIIYTKCKNCNETHTECWI